MENLIDLKVDEEDKIFASICVELLQIKKKKNGYFHHLIHFSIQDLIINKELAKALIEFKVQLIMHKKKGVVDHINRDRNDNRKCNLRYATNSENSQNRRKNNNGQNCTSKFIGVYIKKNRMHYKKPYNATVQVKDNMKIKRVTKSFETEIEAAKWRDEKAKQIFGEFASLNFTPELQQP